VPTIQIVVDTKLVKAADAAAKRENMNRSALIRRALERHLTELRNLDMEARDRAGYLAKPQLPDEYLIFQEATAWPED
jgi:metal-responsive CopG/Arc/MetJ family transcriptional regulator